MTVFFIGAVLLLLLAVALVLWRRDLAPREADRSDPNLSWFFQRESELTGTDDAGTSASPADANDALLDDARLRLLEDGALDAGEPGSEAIDGPALNRGGAMGRFPYVLLALGVVVFSAMIYLQTGALEDVLIQRELASITPEDGDAAREALLARIEKRSATRLDNLQYLSLLGRLYMAAEDYPAAQRSFDALAERAPEDPQALALAAQARFLAADRALDADAQLLAERALAVDPDQRTALGLLGMASFEQEAYAAAITYWTRLQSLEAPGSPGAQMLGEVIEVARTRGGLPNGAVVADAEADGGQALGISVALALGEELPADPAATVFVFARRADAEGGMPIAVRRLRAEELPITVRLNDADTMAGQKLSDAGEVRVTAQLSANGQPGKANALYLGASEPVRASRSDATVFIELSPPARS